MEKISTSDLKNRLSACLRKVRAGLVRRASKPLRRGLLTGPAPKADRSVLDALLEDRRDER